MMKNVKTAHTITFKDCCTILRISPNATLDDIKHAYHTQAFKFHPDLHPDNPSAAKRFQLIHKAYTILMAFMKIRSAAAQKKSTVIQNKNSKPSQKTRKNSEQMSRQKQQASDTPIRQPEQGQASHQEQKASDIPISQPEQTQESEQIRMPDQTFGKIPAKEEVLVEEKRVAIEERRVDVFEKEEILLQPSDESFTYYVARDMLSKLCAGFHIYVQVPAGYSNAFAIVDVTIPENYVLGHAIQLKGMGKTIGCWQGDLYLTLLVDDTPCSASDISL